MDPADYAKALRVVRRSMSPMLKSTHDPEDFVQEACLQVVARGLDSSLLTRIAFYEMVHSSNLFRWDEQSPPERKKRRSRRKLCLPLASLDREHLDDFKAIQPSAQENVEAGEAMERLLEIAADDDQRAMILLACQGYTYCEIADMTGSYKRKVQRKMTDFRRRYEEKYPPDGKQS